MRDGIFIKDIGGFTVMSDQLTIAGKNFDSRLMVGTGRHRSMAEMVSSIEASGAQIVTVAIGRLDLSNPQEKTILDFFDWINTPSFPTRPVVKLQSKLSSPQDLAGKSPVQTG